MEQLTGFSRLVSAHGCRRVQTVHLHWRTEDKKKKKKMYEVFGSRSGTYTLENRRCTECLVLEAALSSSPTQNNSCLHQLLPPLPANSIANLAKHEAQQQCFPRYQPENAKLLAKTSVCPVHLLPIVPSTTTHPKLPWSTVDMNLNSSSLWSEGLEQWNV